jgi:hypothetical protein
MKTIIGMFLGVAVAAVTPPAFAAYDASSSEAVAGLPASPISRAMEARAVPELAHNAYRHEIARKPHAVTKARKMPNGLNQELGGPV